MALRPGLRAFSLASGSAAASGSQVRAFSATASALQQEAKKSEASVQAADQQTRDRERIMRRMPMGIDMTSMYDKVIFEPIADPEFQLSWITKSGGASYAFERFKRWYSDQKYAHDAGVRGLFPGAPSKQARIAWVFRRPHATFPELMPALEDIYTRYQSSQASGDLSTVKATSIGPARERATKVAQSLRGGKWQLIKHNKPPQFISFRAGAMDMENTEIAVQVVVRFDTVQQLTTRGQTRTLNVVENVVFDRRENGAPEFVIKDTLETDKPDFLK